jgi:hypothetical protein
VTVAPGSWIQFRIDLGFAESHKTGRWLVEARDSVDRLGEVKWHVPWRGYAFHAAAGSIFEEDCLREIAKFCEDRTKSHRAAGKVAAG